MSRRVKLPSTSRMQATPLHQQLDSDGRAVNVYAWGTWEPPDIQPHDSDSVYVVTDNDVGRADLISFKFYGTPDLFWVILLLNGILDQFTGDSEQLGLATGTVLRIPDKGRIAAILSSGATVTASNPQS